MNENGDNEGGNGARRGKNNLYNMRRYNQNHINMPAKEPVTKRRAWRPHQRIVLGEVLTALAEGVNDGSYVQLSPSRWLQHMGYHSQEWHHHDFHQLETTYLQLGELATKVKKKKRRLWLWTAASAHFCLLDGCLGLA